MADKVLMCPPWGQGEPVEIEAKPELLVPLMTAGWRQIEPPQEKNDVHD